MKRLPSFSRLDRVMLCPAAAVLPQVDVESEAGERGRALHAFLAHPGDREEALAAVPEEYREACNAIDLDALGVDRRAGAQELALAYDVETCRARSLQRGPDGKYETTQTEFHGIADWVALKGSDGIALLDWKTGYSRVKPAAKNWQLRAAALAACRLYGRTRATVAIVCVREGDEPIWDVAQLEPFDLDEAAYELSELRSKLVRLSELAEPPKVKVGAHCHRCPAMLSCRAFGGVLARVASPDPMKVAEDLKALLTPETARLAYERRRMMGEVLAVVDAALKAYAAEHPIDLGDGTVYGQVERQVTEIDAEKAYAVLGELYGPGVAVGAIEMDATKASLERGMRLHQQALKSAGQKAFLSHLTREALAALKQAGAVRERLRKEVREHRERAGLED